MFARLTFYVAHAIALLFLTAGPASAQALPGCEIVPASETRASYYQCRNGLQIELEAGSSIEIQAIDAVPPDQINLLQGGAWISLPTGSKDFQIDTPRLTAAVRGTEFAVTADPTNSTVFVLSGRVQVTRNSDGQSTLLNAGSGITVSEGTPFEASHWSTNRIDQLNSRFGK